MNAPAGNTRRHQAKPIQGCEYTPNYYTHYIYRHTLIANYTYA